MREKEIDWGKYCPCYTRARTNDAGLYEIYNNDTGLWESVNEGDKFYKWLKKEFQQENTNDKREIALAILIAGILVAGGFLLGMSWDTVKYVRILREKDAKIHSLTETIELQKNQLQSNETLINNLIQHSGNK